jgi:hypothetical protein
MYRPTIKSMDAALQLLVEGWELTQHHNPSFWRGRLEFSDLFFLKLLAIGNSGIEYPLDSANLHKTCGLALLKRRYLTETYMRIDEHESRNGEKYVKVYQTVTRYKISELGESVAKFGSQGNNIFYPFDGIGEIYRAGHHLRGLTAVKISDAAAFHIRAGGAYAFTYKGIGYRFQCGNVTEITCRKSQQAFNEFMVAG